MNSKCSCEDDDHRELDECEVDGGFAVASGCDPSEVVEPGVGALDRPAVASERVGGLDPFLAAAVNDPDRCAGWDRSPARRGLLICGSIPRSCSCASSRLPW